MPLINRQLSVGSSENYLFPSLLLGIIFAMHTILFQENANVNRNRGICALFG